MIRIFALVFNTILAVCVVALTYVLFFEQAPLIYNNSPFPVLKHQVREGDVIPIRINLCSLSSNRVAYRVTRSFRNIDTREYVEQKDVTVHIEPGCREGISMINTVQSGMKQGRYKVIGLSIVSGTMRQFQVPWESEIFEVVK